MATVIKFGTLCLDGTPVRLESRYEPGKALSFIEGNSISWIAVNGILIADRCLLSHISWDDLNAQGLVFGKRVTIGQQTFQARLLKLGDREGVPNEWDAALDIIGEDNDLLHWGKIYSLGQEQSREEPECRASCGYNWARSWAYFGASYRNAYIGYRPVLEPIPSDAQVTGKNICAIGNQSIIYGTVLEQTPYDILLKPAPNTVLAEGDNWKLAMCLPDGNLVVDRSLAVIQNMSCKTADKSRTK